MFGMRECGDGAGLALEAGARRFVRGEPGGRSLTATSRSSERWRARYTSPMPPAPSGATIWYWPSRAPGVTNASDPSRARRPRAAPRGRRRATAVCRGPGGIRPWRQREACQSLCTRRDACRGRGSFDPRIIAALSNTVFPHPFTIGVDRSARPAKSASQGGLLVFERRHRIDAGGPVRRNRGNRE